MKDLFRVFGILFLAVLFLASCKQQEQRSNSTGWKYNDPEWGGFEKINYEGQVTGPNLVLIEGGTFVMGYTEEDATYEWNNVARRVTVSSFYMDETEVTNIDYREYLGWLKRVYQSYPEVYQNALPDTLVWREELAYNEPLVETYLRYPSFDEYPVVGVSWVQANDFAKWRSDRVNEMLLIEKGVINPNPQQTDSDNFNTKAYLAGQYQPSVRKNLPDLTNGGERPVRFEDGIMLPDYRLPTEAEWEYAALALIGEQSPTKDEIYNDRRYFPWDNYTARYKRHDKNQGKMMANFRRGGGDYMGMAGRLNDKASISAPVKSFVPNDFGLYNMAGNVSEWVADVYRVTTFQELSDAQNQELNPHRGNVFSELVKDENGNLIDKDSLGRLKTRQITDEEVQGRDNYKKGDVRNFSDDDNEYVTYGYGKSSLVNDQSRVIKGGSWEDRLYWLSPGQRRFLDENKSSRAVGFRCAMTRMGSQAGNEDPDGNYFGKPTKVRRRYK
jgi:gliding motility-associated lipoprotein GldJ